MTTSGHALMIVGSPRRKKSTSYVLASSLAARLRENGWTTGEAFAVFPRPDEAECNELTQAVDEADLVVVACPLYVDQLPAGVVAALEQLHLRRDGRTVKPRGLAAIVNCGFPEAHHNDTSLAILKRFAELDGFEWRGGLSRGMGGAIAAQPLETVRIGARGVDRALKMAANALARGESIPALAREVISTPPFPKWAYRFLGNIDLYRLAMRAGVAGRMCRVPDDVEPF